jgi:hypothetical protein
VTPSPGPATSSDLPRIPANESGELIEFAFYRSGLAQVAIGVALARRELSDGQSQALFGPPLVIIGLLSMLATTLAPSVLPSRKAQLRVLTAGGVLTGGLAFVAGLFS